MIENQEFPTAPEELTAEWLTDALRKDGCIQQARVVSLAQEVIGEGVGFLGQIVRLTPTYDQAEASAPRTLIGKFPTSVQSARNWPPCMASICAKSTSTAT